MRDINQAHRRTTTTTTEAAVAAATRSAMEGEARNTLSRSVSASTHRANTSRSDLGGNDDRIHVERRKHALRSTYAKQPSERVAPTILFRRSHISGALPQRRTKANNILLTAKARRSALQQQSLSLPLPTPINLLALFSSF